MSNVALYLVTVLVWGSTWIAIEFQLGVVEPEVSVFYRYLLASLLLFAWCALRRQRLGFAWYAHTRFALLGLLLFSLNYVLTYRAQVHISSALTAIVFSTMLWMNLFNARIFFGNRPPGSVFGGSLLGILGIAVLFMPEVGHMAAGRGTLFGTSLALVGAFVASLGNMASQSAQRRGLPVVQSNAWGMLYGAAFSAAAALVEGRPFVMDYSLSYLGSLAYLAVFGSIVGFGSYLTLLGRIGAAKAGYAMVMFPVVAILIALLVGEIPPTWNLAAGAALAIAGNILVLRSSAAGNGRRRDENPGSAVGAAAIQSSPPCQEMNFHSAPSRTSTSV